MPHIHTRPGDHDWTVSAHIVWACGGEPRVLFHRHKSLGRWLQVGGHVEVGETPWAAVAHEVAEESGYRLADLAVLQPPLRLRAVGPEAVLHPVPVCLSTHRFGDGSDHYHTNLCFALLAAGPPDRGPAAGESHELRWLTAGELAGLPPREVFGDAVAIALHVLGEVLPAWEPVPASLFSLAAGPVKPSNPGEPDARSGVG